MNNDLYTPSNFAELLTRVPGNYQRKRWSLYDRQTYVSAATRNLNFFGEKVGSSATKTLQKTNMTANGSLPANNWFIVVGVQATIIPAGNVAAFGAKAVAPFVNDVYLLARNGVLQCNVDQKIQVQDGPLMKFPPQQRLGLDAALADSSTAAADSQSRIAYAQADGPLYKVDPFLLEPMQAFNVQALWPDAAVTLSADAEIQIDLVGLLFAPN